MRKILTNKISEELPCGINIKHMNEYYAVKSKYANIISEIQNENYNISNINNVKREIISLLETKSKDLELFILLIYLSVMVEGIVALEELLGALLELVEKFFMQLFPCATEYIETEEEIIELKLNIIKQLDLKLVPLINEYTFIDRNSVNLTFMLKMFNDAELNTLINNNTSSCMRIIISSENIILLLRALFKELSQYDNYNNNESIVAPSFSIIIEHLNNIINKIKKHQRIVSINDINKQQENIIVQDNSNLEGLDQKNIIKNILNYCELLKKYSSYKVIAYTVEYCIRNIPEDSIELAKCIRNDELISLLIDRVVNLNSDNNNNNNEPDNS